VISVEINAALPMHVRRHPAEDGNDGEDQQPQCGLSQAVHLELPHGAAVAGSAGQPRREAPAVDGGDGDHGEEKTDLRQQQTIVDRPERECR
jgi:hypothetical protein